MQHRDSLYETLELSPRASAIVIKAAYRCLAQHHHPDKNSGADAAVERLAMINHAYAVLSDPVRRHAYDRAMASQHHPNERRGAGAAAPGNRGPLPADHYVLRPFGFRPLD